ncbi:MAG TPA: DUF2911 domain-containing protein [Gemmatimonadaceae bacterium]|nr:DUF2911 domain-containing protein [Gemmatimonadaceae bacterium]
MSAAIRTARCALAFLATSALGPALRAQIRASEPASVSQTVDGTKITIEYSRPRARGRDNIFGTRDVKWNEVWTPGANYATTLEANHDITLDGHPVPKGKYSLWLVVKKSGPWTFVLDPRAKLFHMAHPDSTSSQIRFDVKAQSAPFTEVLTWTFPNVSATGATLAMAWIKTRVSVEVGVPPSLIVELPSADATPYLGRYEFAPMTKEDSAKAKKDAFVVTYENGILKGEFDPIDDYMRKFALIRIGTDTFAPGIYEKGVIYEVLRPDMTIEFALENGRASSLEMRDDSDTLEGKATRVP